MTGRDPRPATPRPADDLERALFDLGRDLDWPERRNLAPSVRTRLRAAPSPRPAFASGFLRSRRAVAVAAIAAAIALAATLSMLPPTRGAIADRLGLPGVSISVGDGAPPRVGGSLDLGERASLADLEERVARDDILPPPAEFGTPDDLYILDRPGGGQVTYVYAPRPDLPEVGDSGVGLLISQVAGRTNESFIRKRLGPSTTLDVVTVGGARAFWIEGAPHVFYYEDANGEFQEDSARLAGNVLLFEQAGKTIRIESSLSRERVIAIAEDIIARSGR